MLGAALRNFPSVLCLLSLGACSTISGFPKSAQDDDVEIKANQPYFASNVRSNEDAISDDTRGGLTRQQYRDAVVYGRLGVIDVRYFEFEKALTSTNNGVSTGADLTVLLLNGFGATTGAAPAKAALAAASAGVVGTKATVNTDLFYQKTLPALVAQMQAGRQQQLAVIKAGLGVGVDKYPLGEALNDVQNYYIAGTLPSAVQQVTSSAGAALATANNDLKLLRDQAFVDASVTAEPILDRVAKLSADQASAVLKLMKPRLSERTSSFQQTLKKQYPGIEAIDNGVTAQKLLKSWVVMDDRTATFQKEWTDALDASTK